MVLTDSELPPESEEDNIEYKRLLTYDMIDSVKLDSLVTQMIWRIKEGDGKAVYYLGINDNGTIYGLDTAQSKETIQVFKTVVKKADVEIFNFNTIKVKNLSNKLYYKIGVKFKCIIKPETRILIVGPENSGKTTLVSGLVHKQLDNGKGYLRNLLVSHKHELYSGKSNSITIKTISQTQTNNLTLIDTPSNILENKNYLDQLIQVSNCGLILIGPDDKPDNYTDYFTKNNFPFTIIKTKSLDGLDMTKELPIHWIKSCEKFACKFNELEDKDQENKTIILTKLYSGDCLYLLTCVQISGTVNQGDNIFFKSGLSGQIESIQYMGCSLTKIDANVTFTCFIKTDQIIKKLKGEIFYSI